MTYVYNSTRTYEAELTQCTKQLFQSENCLNLTEPAEEKYIEYDMCVWDYGTPKRSRIVMLTKIIGGFFLPLLTGMSILLHLKKPFP